MTAEDRRTRRLRELQEHELKCWPEFFQALVTGEKTFELRKDDRGYRYGDVLWLREWRRERIVDGVDIGNYTGREMRRTVTYVLSGFGLQPDFVCLGLAVLDTEGDRPPQFPYPMNKEDHRLDCDIRTSRDGWDANCTCQAQEIRRWQDMDRKREEVFQRVIEQRNQLLKENKELRKVKADVR